jgi:hypothetical protein
MNPKLQAINNAGLMDAEEAPAISAPVSLLTEEPSLIQPLANDMGDSMDKNAREQEAASIERQIERLPDPEVKAPLHDKLRREKSMSAPDQIPSAQALNTISQEVHQEQTKADAKEGKEIYDQMMGMVTGGAMFMAAGAGLLPFLVPKLTPSHGRIEEEHQLLSDHGVPGSGRSASRYDLGLMAIPDGLPAISKEMEMQRSASYTRSITDDK